MQYKEILENISDWLWAVDTSGKYTYCSHNVVDFLGYTAEEVIGKTPFDFMSEKEASRVLKIFEDLAMRRAPIKGLENTNIHKDGSIVILKTSGIPVYDKEGIWLGYEGMDTNITERKELVLLYEALQTQVEKNQTLLEENKLFISDMVHQMRTPLSVIMINSSLIELGTKDQVSGYVTQINSAINMLSNSYEDLNYIISSDTIEYNAIKINFAEFLHERIDFFEVIAQANDKTIYTDITDGIEVSMNDTELERLIDNNLSNAIKHSYDKSEVKIVLEKNHSEIILKFISKGKAIKDIDKIFDKNYTESHHAKRNLGLGLNMVKSICEKNHVNYSVHSKDETNIFTYYFKV